MINRGDTVRLGRTQGTVVALATQYNQHGHAIPVAVVLWPNGNATPWAESELTVVEPESGLSLGL